MSQKSSQFQAGLVGAGYICEYHVAALRRAGVPIVGVCDLDPARAKATADRLKIPAMPSMQALREAGANVMHVLTPPDSHADVTLAALSADCHVLVEKPLATDGEDCRRIAAVAAAKHRAVCVNHSLLFDPQVRKAIDTVRSGKLGKIVSVDILRGSAYPPYAGGSLPPHYRSAGYPFRDLGVHALYLMEAMLGPIENVSAEFESKGGDPNLAYDEWRAMVRCKEGLGQFQLSWNVKPMQSQMIIQGTRGVLRVDLFLMFQALRKTTPLPKAAERLINAMTDTAAPMVQVPLGVWGFLRKNVLPYHGLQDLVAEFYRALEAGAAPPVSVEQATRVVEWTETVARNADAEYAKTVAALPTCEQVDYLVTGASGGVGGAIAERLLRDGKRVRLMMRRAPEHISQGACIALGDLGDPSAVDRAVRGARIVIHAGAAMGGPWLSHLGGTVAGTQNVIAACRTHGVEKLVHISSMSVIDWAGGDRSERPVNEETPLEPRAEERGSYTRAKLAAEQAVSKSVRVDNLPAVILRPGQIFGGKIKLLTGAVARKLGKRWLILGAGDVALPLVTLEDVVDATIAAAESDLHKGEIIQLIDAWTPTQNQLLTEIARVSGERYRIWRLPRPIVFGLGAMSELMLGLLKKPSPLSRYRLKSALSRRTFASKNADPLLHWKPRVGARQAVHAAFTTAGGSANPTHSFSNANLANRSAAQTVSGEA